MQKEYEVVIIGGGPAGLSAAIYARRAELETLVIEKEVMGGGQILRTDVVDNYPGFPGIGGFELGMKMKEHAQLFGVNWKTAQVLGMKVENQMKTIQLQEEMILTRYLVIAAGAQYRHLEVPGEAEFTGKGVSYCAACDGAFFREKTVAVVGGSDVAAGDAILLSKSCRQVYLIHRRGELRAAPFLQTRLQKLENVTLCLNAQVEEIQGDQVVSSILIHHLQTGKRQQVAVEGVFAAVGTIPDSKPYESVVRMDEQGYLLAGEDCRTSVPGIYAAGDIRRKPLRQLVTAVADGANAITSLESDLLQSC